MTDYTRIIDRLTPREDGETPVRHRTGVVAAVNADGTIDVSLGGVIVPDVTLIGPATVNDPINLLVWKGDLLALGRSSTYHLISSTTVTGGANYDSGALPAGYRNLRLIARGARNLAGLSAINVRFNGDSATNYRRTVDRVDGAGTRSIDFNQAATAYLPGQWGDQYGNLILDIIAALRTNVTIQSHLGGREGTATTEQQLALGFGVYVAGPVTSIQATITNGFDAADFDLYGSR